ncbi:ABC transporter permease [Brevibacterium jeotgali]|uniref:Transport permease protein n=1 Tax=Brevibacterium jeotgali TaxID=1262550 RepID=A0A2H1L862_9MICO|nr:ABC transporter permease [Brevibacterium jeotgali]TWC01600.1 ABC-2 type transport system permease protein [Brevibacterium jeotgali]SMY13087.1 ABC-2 type transport system permease protein [Brevibacterium jeotgali]
MSIAAPAPPAPSPSDPPPGGRSASATRTSGAHLWRDAVVMSHRSIRHSLRNIDALLIGIILPVALMLMFTYVFGGAISPEGGYIDFVVPSIILLCAGYGAGTTAVSVTTDMTEGIIDRFRTMRVVSSAVLLGHVVASMARNLVSTAVVLTTALLLGFRPSAGPLEWFAAIGLIMLFILALSWMSAAWGLVARTVDAAASLSFFILFVPYVSSAFVPIDTLPTWLQGFAQHQPMSPIIDTLRALLLDGDAGGAGWVACVWLVGILAVSVVASALLWRRTRR